MHHQQPSNIIFSAERRHVQRRVALLVRFEGCRLTAEPEEQVGHFWVALGGGVMGAARTMQRGPVDGKRTKRVTWDDLYVDH